MTEYNKIETGDVVDISFGGKQSSEKYKAFVELDRVIKLRNIDGNKDEAIKTLYVKVFKDALKEPPPKTYTQEQLNKAIEDAFLAARKGNESIDIAFGAPFMKYPTITSYMESLKNKS